MSAVWSLNVTRTLKAPYTPQLELQSTLHTMVSNQCKTIHHVCHYISVFFFPFLSHHWNNLLLPYSQTSSSFCITRQPELRSNDMKYGQVRLSSTLRPYCRHIQYSNSVTCFVMDYVHLHLHFASHKIHLIKTYCFS